MKTAHALFERFHTIQNILSYLKQRPVNPVDEQYVYDFEKAFITFKYQRVWCPLKQQVVTLNHIEFQKDTLLSQLASKSLSRDLAEISSLSGDALERDLLLKHFKDSRLHFLGPVVPADIARELAEGRLDPSTHKSFEDFEFLFDPRELCLEEIQNLGYRKISELLNPNKKKFVMPEPEDRLFLNLTLEFNEDAACDDEARQRELDEAAKKDPIQSLLRLLVSPGKKQAGFGALTSTTASAGDKDDSLTPSPLKTRSKGIFSSASKASQIKSAIADPSSSDECHGEVESGETAPDEVYSLRKRSGRLRSELDGAEDAEDLRDVRRKMNFNNYLPEDQQQYPKNIAPKAFLPSKQSHLQSVASKMRDSMRSSHIQDMLRSKREQMLTRLQTSVSNPSPHSLSFFGSGSGPSN